MVNKGLDSDIPKVGTPHLLDKTSKKKLNKGAVVGSLSYHQFEPKERGRAKKKREERSQTFKAIPPKWKKEED